MIIYGASWCEACDAAASYLTRRGIPFVEKDVEKASVGRAGLDTTLARAGLEGTKSLPVLDIRGTVTRRIPPLRNGFRMVRTVTAAGIGFALIELLVSGCCRRPSSALGPDDRGDSGSLAGDRRHLRSGTPRCQLHRNGIEERTGRRRISGRTSLTAKHLRPGQGPSPSLGRSVAAGLWGLHQPPRVQRARRNAPVRLSGRRFVFRLFPSHRVGSSGSRATGPHSSCPRDAGTAARRERVWGRLRPTPSNPARP